MKLRWPIKNARPPTNGDLRQRADETAEKSERALKESQRVVNRVLEYQADLIRRER